MSFAPFRIGRATIGPGNPCFIIAEMAWAHDGSADKATRIARGAARAGADAISIHVTSLPDYMVPQYGNAGTVSAGKPANAIYDYLRSINLDRPAITALAAASREAGLAVCLMPNDLPSLEFARSLEPDALVLSPACFVEDEFVAALAASGVPIVLRIGGATLGEIERTVERLRAGGTRDLLLLHGFQTYPTRLEEAQLRAVGPLERLFGCAVGLADHIDGGDPIAITIPALAIATGAVALEKHITWDREQRGEDFESALDPTQFAAFVRYVRQAETALGSERMPPFSGDVLRYRQVVRKRVVAAADLPAGTRIEPHHLACRRSDEGASPGERESLVGRRLRTPVARNHPITLSILE